jgi:predicted nucleic acid-binding protein
MICLDTNYLIRGIAEATSEAEELSGWYRDGEPLITPMPAWFEFLCGPLTEAQEATARAFLARIVPFGEREASESARLFNAIGRNRKYRIDAMIAGTALASNARLATNNRDDFAPFVPFGLKLL